MQKHLVGADVGFATFGLSAFKLDPDVGIKFVGSVSLETKKASKAAKARVDSDNIRRIGELVMLIDRFVVHTCDVALKVDMEKVFVAAEFPTAGTQSSKAALAFGMGTGLFSSYLTCNRMPFEHVTPDDVKLIATGRRQKVDKLQVEEGITRIMEHEGIDFEGSNLKDYLDAHYNNDQRSHVADSVAAAWWAVTNSNNYKSFIA